MNDDSDRSDRTTAAAELEEREAPANPVGRVRVVADEPAREADTQATAAGRRSSLAQALLLGVVALLVMIGALLIILWFAYRYMPS